MKAMTFIISLFMLPLLGTTSPSFSTSAMSGVWTSDCGSLTLIIEGDRRGLRVRNHRFGNWAYYDRIRGRRNTFVKGRSKSLQLRSSREILFEDRAKRTSLILRKTRIDRNGFAKGNRGYYNDRYSQDYRDGYNRRYPSQNYRGAEIRSFDAKNLRRSIDDKWYNQEYRVKIKIKDTDSGIKMKRDGRRNYTHYLQDYRNPTVFSDGRGNSIEIISKYEIVWYDERNGKSLYFTRD